MFWGLLFHSFWHSMTKKGVKDMKQRTIDRLLDEGNVQAFEFGNDDYMVFWAVTPGHGKLVARRIVQIEDSG